MAAAPKPFQMVPPSFQPALRIPIEGSPIITLTKDTRVMLLITDEKGEHGRPGDRIVIRETTAPVGTRCTVTTKYKGIEGVVAKCDLEGDTWETGLLFPGDYTTEAVFDFSIKPTTSADEATALAGFHTYLTVDPSTPGWWNNYGKLKPALPSLVFVDPAKAASWAPKMGGSRSRNSRKSRKSRKCRKNRRRSANKSRKVYRMGS